jgi:iron complex outermembrane receptor protein
MAARRLIAGFLARRNHPGTVGRTIEKNISSPGSFWQSIKTNKSTDWMYWGRAIAIGLIWMCAAFAGMGQSIEITVTDVAKTPLVGATVRLANASDSAARYGVTDASGVARFNGMADAVYLAQVRYVGYQPLEKTILTKSNQRSFTFQLREDAIALGEVTVTARRPLIRQEDDKMIIDPEPLANISANTLEVLEATPGLFVDQEGGIYLNSAAAAAIYINGREQRMSAQDIATILRSLPPGSIQRIEVLRTPSTKYDAASSGGIINVVLKKGVKIGRFGALNLGMNQGVYGNQFAGFSLNNGGEKGAYYLNVNYNREALVEDINSQRFLAADSLLRQGARTRQLGDQGYVGFGLNHDPSARINLSYDTRVNASLRRSATRNINLVEAPENLPQSENDNRIDNRAPFLNFQHDLGMVFKIDSLGSDWDTRFSYSFNHNSTAQAYESSFLFPNPSFIAGEGDNLQRRHFFQFQSDLNYLLPHKTRLETGVKSTLQDYRSQADYFFNVDGDLIPDILRTNAFNYQERISAAYAQASKTLGGNFILKGGVRLEHTYMRGNQTVPADTSFLINRADWFPYVYLSRSLIEIAGYELRGYLIYRKTINRPGYQSLNPYIKYIDQYLYEEGNPALRPQFTDNFEANISFDDTPIFAIGRNYTRDIFSNVIYQDEDFPEVAVRTFDNVGKNKETYFRLLGAIPPGGKYFFVAGAQYNLNEYEGRYENEPFTFRRGSWRFFTFHSLSLTKQTRLTMNGFMMLNGQQNFYELDTFGQLNFGLTHTMLDKKLFISLYARDVLRSMVTRFSLEQGSIRTFGDRYFDNRRFGLNARYNFGIRKRETRQSAFPFQIEE